MLELPHTVVGATIATKIPNPLVSIPFAFLSHFLLDLIPHWNPSLYTETEKMGQPTKKSTIVVIIDTIFSLLSGLAFAYRFWPNWQRAVFILLACFAAVAPDVVEGFYFFLGKRNKFLLKLVRFQHEYQQRTRKIPGILTQIFIVLVCFYLTLST